MRRRAWRVVLVAALAAAATPTQAQSDSVRVFDAAWVDLDTELADGVMRDGYVTRSRGQVVEVTVKLPKVPDNQRDARRIVAQVQVRPEPLPAQPGGRPGDLWSRLGAVSVLGPDDEEVELMRFATGFGAPAALEQDVTVFAPLLHGRRTLRMSLSTVTNPGWRVSLRLVYTKVTVGFRRPTYVEPLFNMRSLTDEASPPSDEVVIPDGLAQPRIRILSTGHSADGGAEYEFVTRTMVLRVDGREVARWRPWTEGGGPNRPANPWAGRQEIDGRELWTSDLDRSGWQPGAVVEPLIVPAPELTPGRHRVELEVLDGRADDDHGHGYWRISAVVAADEPWPAPSPE